MVETINSAGSDLYFKSMTVYHNNQVDLFKRRADRELYVDPIDPTCMCRCEIDMAQEQDPTDRSHLPANMRRERCPPHADREIDHDSRSQINLSAVYEIV